MSNTFVDPDLVAAVLALQPGDHLCLIYDDDPAEQLPAILPFLNQGLLHGEQCVYVADDHTIDEFRRALIAYGVDVETEESKGALLLWTREEWRQPGELDSDRMAEQVGAIVEKALAAGFSGIRFGVEMTWTLGPDIDAEKLRHWEATINTILTPDVPGRIICQYSRSRLSPEAIQAGICTHPVAVIGGDVCPNPFYEGPSILDGRSYSSPTPTSEQVDWLISQLRWARTFGREREQRIRAEAAVAEGNRNEVLSEELKRVSESLEDSEQDLRDFFDNGAIALHWVGPDGTVLRVNKAELELLGYAEDEYVGRDIRGFHADAEVIEDILARLARREILHDYEARLIARDGTIRTVLIDSSVLWRNGEFVHTRCFTRDITTRNERELAAARLGAIVNTSDDAIISKDLNGIVMSWNPAAERLFGYKAEEIIGQSIRRIIPADRQDEEDDVLGRIRKGNRVDHFETVRQRKDGSLVPIALTVSPVTDSQGRIVGASKIARDITERKAAEQAIQRSLALKDQFLSLVSHELRTPIATIIGNSQILLDRFDRLTPADRQQALTDVHDEGERLHRIVENLLFLTRFESGADLASQAVELQPLIDDAISSLRKRSPRRSIRLEVEGSVPQVAGEPTLVALVLENLLGNADKYSLPEAPIEVVLTNSDANTVVVHVLDRGIGIEEADLPRVFEAFYRADAAKGTASGMGLGLAVCRTILDAQGGSIQVERRPGGGSDFSFCLPAFHASSKH